MTKDHGPSIKDDEAYEALREKGYGKGKAAAIANAKANPDMHPGHNGGEAERYEDRTVEELHDLTGDLDIEGRSTMNKAELIEALRSR